MPEVDMDKVFEDVAKQYGMTVEQFRAAMKKDQEENWCHCEKQGDPVFHDDGEGRGKHCVPKHHYHCSNCGKLTQIG